MTRTMTRNRQSTACDRTIALGDQPDHRACLQVGHPPPPGVEHALGCECDQCARRARPGPKPRASAPSSETLRFRCTPDEARQIREACAKRGRELSSVARELLLAWASG